MHHERWRGAKLALTCALGACVAMLVAQHVVNGAAPLSPPPVFRGSLPPAAPPAQMRLLQLPTGITQRSAAFAYRGGSFFDARDFVMTAVLVQHPRGDVLIDTGFGRALERHFAQMPLYFRLTTRYGKQTPAADQLKALGYAQQRMRGILLTHAHWDHASGLADFPGVPVLVTKAERQFVDQGGFLTAAARTAHARWEIYRFEGGAYLGFPAHHDVHGDGSIVVVPAPGHTPGSVIVFVTLPGERRYAFVGDLAWQREGILQREERPFPQRALGDFDGEGVRAGLRKMWAVSRRFPQIEIVPAHDARGFASIPRR
ncbi:MAG: hypothetical protein RL385_4471 [Pseudomonadota bacterium]|jgi:glyoxylase-like metal-dependent hydrolase (beta-lactamase superfamily II)